MNMLANNTAPLTVLMLCIMGGASARAFLAEVADDQRERAINALAKFGIDVTASEDKTQLCIVLDRKELTDADLRHLEAFPDLTELYLTDLNITDAGLRHLRLVKALRYLSIVGCAAITDAGLENLQGLS